MTLNVMTKEIFSIKFFLSVLLIYVVFTTEMFKITQRLFKMTGIKLVEGGAITKVGLLIHSIVAYVLVTKVVPEIVKSLNNS